jgi:hypothetical protein
VIARGGAIGMRGRRRKPRPNRLKRRLYRGSQAGGARRGSRRHLKGGAHRSDRSVILMESADFSPTSGLRAACAWLTTRIAADHVSASVAACAA